MKYFDTLLGFAVLTGPLWLILILLPVSVWIAVKLAKRFKQRSAKIAGRAGLRQLELLRLVRKTAAAYRYRADRHENENQLKEAA